MCPTGRPLVKRSLFFPCHPRDGTGFAAWDAERGRRMFSSGVRIRALLPDEFLALHSLQVRLCKSSQTARSTALLTNSARPPANNTLTPPGWWLRAAA